VRARVRVLVVEVTMTASARRLQAVSFIGRCGGPEVRTYLTATSTDTAR